jgi:hypothetical protein
MKTPTPALPGQRTPKHGISQHRSTKTFVAAVTLIIGALGGTGAQAEQEAKPLTQGVKTESGLGIDFAKIQSNCVQIAGLKVGSRVQWKGCRLERAGFFGTIGLLDFYFANYCLTSAGEACAAQAQVLFSNRAYRPEAVARSFRVDPAGTRYDDPLMIGSPDQNLLATNVHYKGKKQAELNYAVWSGTEWTGVDTVSWHQELPRQLPDGAMVRLSAHVQPDPTTLSMRLPLFQKSRSGTWSALHRDAELNFAVEGTRMVVSTMTVTKLDTSTTKLPQTASGSVPSMKPLDQARVQVASLPIDQ